MDSEESSRKRPRLPDQGGACPGNSTLYGDNSELNTQQMTDLQCEDFDILHPVGSKVINDPVHGHLELHPLFVAIIDTPQFQRLRYLKQLGAGYFVYPGASHNRFEHSLGVCYLAGLLVKALRRRQPELGITVQDVLCVQIAGLCHDLGHGPFSHVFDKLFIPCVKPGDWKHEKASIDMFDHLVKVNNLEEHFAKYGLEEAHRVFIKEQIVNKPLTEGASGKIWYCKPHKAFLYEIVANERNEVDVDKWDYFKRDCHHLGLSSGFDHMRFIQFSRVIHVGDELQICVRDKEVFNMYEMFHTRHALHRRAYQHKVVQAVEVMLVEAMKEAEECITIPGDDGKRYKISDCIDHMDAFTNLNDSIFHLILLDTRDDLHLKRAQTILRNIERRKLYKCVGETEPIAEGGFTRKSGVQIKREILEQLQDQSERVEMLELDTSRFVIQIATLDFGKKNENPVNDIRFFSKVEQDKAQIIRASEVSFMLPQKSFEEQLVRLFLRPTENDDADRERLQLLFDGFERWCRENELKNPKLELTPWKTSDYPERADYRTPERSTRLARNNTAMNARRSFAF